MNKRSRNILFFILLAILIGLIGYAVYINFIANDEFYEDCSNCYKNGEKRSWDMGK